MKDLRVGACVTCGAPKGEWLVDDINMTQDCVDETAKGEHEPVCFLRETNWSYEIAPWDDPNGIPVYTAPPKREWVGLTDEEKAELDAEHGDDTLAHLDAIEAKLREKNS